MRSSRDTDVYYASFVRDGDTHSGEKDYYVECGNCRQEFSCNLNSDPVYCPECDRESFYHTSFSW